MYSLLTFIQNNLSDAEKVVFHFGMEDHGLAVIVILKCWTSFSFLPSVEIWKSGAL